MSKSKRSGFTLIELLIVVAIIGILASIATANFLNAQIKAKNVRTRADLATMTTGLELYNIDNNAYPTYHYENYEYDGVFQTEFFMGGYFTTFGQPIPYTGPPPLTSPVDYLSSMPKDPFHPPEDDDPPGTRSYIYTSWYYALRLVGPGYAENPIADYGAWRLVGAGPDRDRLDIRILYDPTNGTVSNGDIYRSQKSPLGIPQRGGDSF